MVRPCSCFIIVNGTQFQLHFMFQGKTPNTCPAVRGSQAVGNPTHASTPNRRIGALAFWNICAFCRWIGVQIWLLFFWKSDLKRTAAWQHPVWISFAMSQPNTWSAVALGAAAGALAGHAQVSTYIQHTKHQNAPMFYDIFLASHNQQPPIFLIVSGCFLLILIFFFQYLYFCFQTKTSQTIKTQVSLWCFGPSAPRNPKRWTPASWSGSGSPWWYPWWPCRTPVVRRPWPWPYWRAAWAPLRRGHIFLETCFFESKHGKRTMCGWVFDEFWLFLSILAYCCWYWLMLMLMLIFQQRWWMSRLLINFVLTKIFLCEY